ncbi:MAG: NAD-dependent deacylase [Synergistaceae bacterium]|jgi:NAD-dependent deacetylase|nr:NAD-dependent deacylase [Synergistaceae bacterium]
MEKNGSGNQNSKKQNLKKLVVLTGAGISAESGLRTFRDSDGLWEEHNVMDVASIEGWYRDPKLVTEFYNARRRQLGDVKPNRAHIVLAELEKDFDVRIVTQNVDDLHERAGSTQVIHLHGELTKIRSTRDESKIIDIGYGDLTPGRTDETGAPMRPHIVWFGEAVPLIAEADRLVREADLFAVIGTSLVVYPAAGLVGSLRPDVPAFLVDPGDVEMRLPSNFTVIKEKAGTGVEKMREKLAAYMVR